MDITHAVRVLRRFNAKVERAEAGTFLSGRVNSAGTFTLETGWTSQFSGPTNESFDAIVLTYRFLTLGNEETSLRNLVRAYEAVGSGDLTRNFNVLRRRFNEYLDEQSPMAIEEHRQLTNRDICELFINGGMAHANNEERVTQFEEISTTPFFPHFQFLFTGILRNCFVLFREIRDLNLRAIEATSSASVANSQIPEN
jgi:hypothetical protein